MNQIFGLSVTLCCILIIFPVVKNSLNDGRFDDHVMIAVIVPLVFFFQLVLFCIAASYPLNNTHIFGTMLIFLLTNAISFVEVDLVSRTASIIISVIISVVWGIFILSFVVINYKVILYENIVFSRPIQ
ncbi:hypothetical protein KIW84_046312 [Lathyrus oleraceus]|nr:hypothetical protein KIW84_046312 [Pisum sativum]